MSKSLKIILGFFSVLFMITISFGIFFIMTGSNSGGSKSNGSHSIEGTSGPADTELAKLERGEKEFEVSGSRQGNPVSEQAFSDDLHKMTHQKIMAEEKWGHKRITDESIEEMLEIAEAANYEYQEFYIKTLEQWQAGNFDNAVKVHNIIWNANDGTVGKAQRLMSPVEEQHYIIKQFE